MEFKPFTESDFAVYTQLRSLANPEHPVTEERLRFLDSSRDPEARYARELACQNGAAIGAVSLETPVSNPEAGELELRLTLPAARADLAPALYGRALEVARTLDGRLLRVSVQESHWQYPFWLGRGFEEFDRMWASNLELSRFDPAPFAEQLERARAAGLEVRTLEVLRSETGFLERYYSAIIEMLYDIPSATRLQPWPFELWKSRLLEDPTFLPEAHFIGFVGHDIAGVSQLLRSSRASTIQTGLTGVRRAYRRRGFALALKLEAALYAKAQGFAVVRTNNHVINRPMLSINEMLGFVKEPAQVLLRKPLP